jgi:pyoverdine/dityrosine biosynthesis protein Dit1
MISRVEGDRTPATSSTFNYIQNIFDEDTLKKSCKILSIIQKYRTEVPEGIESRIDEGNLKFLSIIYSQIKAKEPIRLILPAFPFKSPNRINKTLGHLPDKGEHVSLAHLNALCSAIADIYDFGAKLTIASDGIVYSGKSSH